MADFQCVFFHLEKKNIRVIPCCYEDRGKVLWTMEELREVIGRYLEHKQFYELVIQELEKPDIEKFGKVGHC